MDFIWFLELLDATMDPCFWKHLRAKLPRRLLETFASLLDAEADALRIAQYASAFPGHK
jgi:hypothetical protein